MIYAIICFAVVVFLVWFIFKGDSSGNKPVKSSKNELPHYHPHSIKTMFKALGWEDRKILELSIRLCSDMFNQEPTNHYEQGIRMEWLRSKEILEKELKEYDRNHAIVITHLPLSTNKDEVFKMAQTDARLVEAILVQKRKLKEEKHIETFDVKGNIIVTEKGYYCAFFAKDLTKADS